jgi:hypothetical protein
VLSRRQRIDPTRCGNRVAGRLCLYPLVTLPRIAVGHELCAAQIAFLDAAGGRPPPVAGHPVGAVEWGEAFKVVCGLARFAGRNVELPSAVPVPAAAVEAFVADARQHELTPMGRAGGYRSMPRTAALAAALLAFTGDILAADSAVGLREALRPVGRAILVPHPLTRRERPRSWPMPAFLRQALLSDFAVPKASRRWVAADVPAAARGVDQPVGGLEFRHVPQVVAIDDYQELIAAWLRTRSALAGRRFAALALARVCGASSWENAGAALQWHDGRAQSVADQVSGFVVDPRRFWRAVSALAERLWQRGPIDYDSRRQVLSTLNSIDAAVWIPVSGAGQMPALALDVPGGGHPPGYPLIRVPAEKGQPGRQREICGLAGQQPQQRPGQLICRQRLAQRHLQPALTDPDVPAQPQLAQQPGGQPQRHAYRIHPQPPGGVLMADPPQVIGQWTRQRRHVRSWHGTMAPSPAQIPCRGGPHAPLMPADTGPSAVPG